MTKIYYTIIALAFGTLAFGQVGINTQNPQGAFHIDGQKDNPATGIPNTTQQLNDFVVKQSGNVGIGTVSPDTRLHIDNGSTAGAIKIIDGTQGANKVLMSDANGVGTWQAPASIRPTIVGNVNTTVKSVASNLLIGSSITLPQGKWMINIGQLVYTSVAATSTNNLWMRIGLSSSNTAQTTTGFTYVSSSNLVSGWLSPAMESSANSGYSFLSGVIPIEITTTNLTIYMWFGNCSPTTSYNSASLNPRVGNQGENYLFATPIN